MLAQAPSCAQQGAVIEDESCGYTYSEVELVKGETQDVAYCCKEHFECVPRYGVIVALWV